MTPSVPRGLRVISHLSTEPGLSLMSSAQWQHRTTGCRDARRPASKFACAGAGIFLINFFISLSQGSWRPRRHALTWRALAWQHVASRTCRKHGRQGGPWALAGRDEREDPGEDYSADRMPPCSRQAASYHGQGCQG
jgi:hypothetical protein